MKPIYLDYAATTPVDPRVAERMMACLEPDGVFANPASAHFYGREAHLAVEKARAQVASLINADPSEIIWTSGATEADNLAIKGVASMYARRGQHIVTMQTEHKAVLDTCQVLEKMGYSITYLKPNANGELNLEELAAALRTDTILVSLMLVNNETGVIHDLEAISKIVRTKNILLHVDAAQSVGKVDIDIERTPVDLMSLSAHKIYGPKGIGALYIRKKPRIRLEAMIHGGGHERGMRSGTLAPHQIIGMGESYAIAEQEKHEREQIRKHRVRFLLGLRKIKNMHLNSSAETVPHILNVRFEGMIADAILKQLPGIAASTAAACQGKGTEGSYVLRAMGLSLDQVKASIRFSFGRFTTEKEIEDALVAIHSIFSIKE